MKITATFVMAVLLGACPSQAEPVYHTTPDWISSDTPFSTGAALLDLDHDGWLDFVVANGNDMAQQRLAVYYNNGDGTFPLTPDWLSADEEYNGHLSAADVNGDGWIDVAVGLTMADPGTSTARLYLNNEGTLSSLPDWESPDEVAGFQVDFGDVNGDGRPDLAVGTGWPYPGGDVWPNYVYLNINGTLESSPSWVSDDLRDYGDIFFCDANADGWLDLVGVGEMTHTWVYLNDEGTLDTTATWHTTDTPTQFAVMGTYGDVDEDGWTDLFVTDNTQLPLVGRLLRWAGLLAGGDVRGTGRGTGNLRRYDGQVGGLFTTTPTWTYCTEYGSAVALADIDTDGDLDVATGSWWGPTIYFLNTNGLYASSPEWSSLNESVVEAIILGDVDNDGLRWPVESFDATSTPGRHLFQLSRQPIEGIEHVTVDGTLLEPDEFTFDPVHGWVSVGPEPSASVTVAYVYTLKPDMAITNWDDEGNYLYYNLNDATPFGDFDDDGDVDLDDYESFTYCFTGPHGGPVGPECQAGDVDLDGHVDCDDWDAFVVVWTEVEDPPDFPGCPFVAIPTVSDWGMIVMTLLTVTIGTIIILRRGIAAEKKVSG